jgi:DNA-binding response OmpR family regulator
MTGADDYVTKPFSPSELVARVDAIHRRVAITRPLEDAEKDVVSGPFRINVKSRTISKNGEIIDLTQVEYHILEFFIKNRETALDRKSILSRIWGDSYFGDEKIVDVNVRRLRIKIEDDPAKPLYIQTIWGFGYKWGGDGER